MPHVSMYQILGVKSSASYCIMTLALLDRLNANEVAAHEPAGTKSWSPPSLIPPARICGGEAVSIARH